MGLEAEVLLNMYNCSFVVVVVFPFRKLTQAPLSVREYVKVKED